MLTMAVKVGEAAADVQSDTAPPAPHTLSRIQGLGMTSSSCLRSVEGRSA